MAIRWPLKPLLVYYRPINGHLIAINCINGYVMAINGHVMGMQRPLMGIARARAWTWGRFLALGPGWPPLVMSLEPPPKNQQACIKLLRD